MHQIWGSSSYTGALFVWGSQQGRQGSSTGGLETIWRGTANSLNTLTMRTVTTGIILLLFGSKSATLKDHSVYHIHNGCGTRSIFMYCFYQHKYVLSWTLGWVPEVLKISSCHSYIDMFQTVLVDGCWQSLCYEGSMSILTNKACKRKFPH